MKTIFENYDYYKFQSILREMQNLIRTFNKHNQQNIVMEGSV